MAPWGRGYVESPQTIVAPGCVIPYSGPTREQNHFFHAQSPWIFRCAVDLFRTLSTDWRKEDP